MIYIVAPMERDVGLKVLLEDFLTKLQNDWQVTEVLYIQHIELRKNFVVSWIMKIDGVVEGLLYSSLDGISLDGDVYDCARVATWFRKIIPDTSSLYFYEQGLHCKVELESNTTVQEIIENCS